MTLEVKEELRSAEPEPVPFDTEAGNRIVAYLGSQPWGKVNDLIEDLRIMIEGFVINYQIAVAAVEAIKIKASAEAKARTVSAIPEEIMNAQFRSGEDN